MGKGGVLMCDCFSSGAVLGLHGAAAAQAALESLWRLHRGLPRTGGR